MAMLAESRKSKHRLQPSFGGFSKINKRSDGDTSSPGYKMMASMGWAPGKGLGLNETGNIDPIKPRIKNDDAGLGFKVSEKDALAQQSEFQALLFQLNSGSTDGDVNLNEPEKKSKKPKIKSLEKQSEQSSKRVHYKKFTRSKDLSRASEQDLRSILGLSSEKPKVKDSEPEPVEGCSYGLSTGMYFSAGSYVDYFKKRLQEKKNKNEDAAAKEESTSSNSAEEESKNSDKNRSVTWGDIDVSYVDKYIKDMKDTSGSGDELLCTTQCYGEPPTKKKKKKNVVKDKFSEDMKDTSGSGDELLCITQCYGESPTKKKKKKNVVKYKFSEDMKDTSGSGELLCDSQCYEEPPTKKKKKKRNRQCPVEVSEDVDKSVQLNTEKKKKRKFSEEENSKENVAQDQEDYSVPKKKKKQKEKLQSNLSEANDCIDIKDTEALCPGEEANLSEEPKQKKKKKKKNKVDALPEQNE